MRHAAFVISALALSAAGGCDRLKATEDLTSPVVAQGLFLGLNLPDGMDIEGSDLLAYTAACTVFLAYVSDPQALADSPVEGAGVQFASATNGSLPFSDEGSGKYLVTAQDGLVYEPGDLASVSVNIDGDDAKVGVETPDAPEFSLPTDGPYLPALQPVTIDLTGQDYDNLIIAVYDVQKSELVYDNLPTSVNETYQYTHQTEATLTAEIPGDVFRGQGSFLIGVAGMQLANPDTFSGANQALSAFMAGQFSLTYVLTDAAN